MAADELLTRIARAVWLLILLGTPYTSALVVALSEELMRSLAERARAASVVLARDRGVFSIWDRSLYPSRGRKQVFGVVEGGRMVRDVIGRHDEALEGEPLLRPVVLGGVRPAAGRIRLEEAWAHARRELGRLPEALRSLAEAP